jgi:DNA polymerase III sliding clamp (beta) subunit (PCNA family)
MLIKKKPLEFVKAFAGKADTRYVLNGVHMDADNLTATDGHVLGRISQQKELSVKDYPNVEGIDPSQAEEPLKGVIVPIDGVERLAKAIPTKKSTMPILKTAIVNTKVTNEGKLFLAGTTDLETTTPINVKLIDGKFPEVHNVIPKEKGVKQFSVNPALMARAMTAAAKLGLITVEFDLPEKALSPIKITGRTEDGEDVLIIVMPCKGDQ